MFKPIKVARSRLARELLVDQSWPSRSRAIFFLPMHLITGTSDVLLKLWAQNESIDLKGIRGVPNGRKSARA
jgi:hypothetical protein